VSHRHLSDHLSDLVESTLADLERSKVRPRDPTPRAAPPPPPALLAAAPVFPDCFAPRTGPQRRLLRACRRHVCRAPLRQLG